MLALDQPHANEIALSSATRDAPVEPILSIPDVYPISLPSCISKAIIQMRKTSRFGSLYSRLDNELSLQFYLHTKPALQVQPLHHYMHNGCHDKSPHSHIAITYQRTAAEYSMQESEEIRTVEWLP